MRKATVIINRKSGRKKKYSMEYRISEQLKHQADEVDIRYTDGSDAMELARESAPGSDLIVSAGGDGTLGEIIAGIIGSGADTRLSVLPAGTVNDYARALGLTVDMETAIAGLSKPQDVLEADVIRYNEHHAAYLIALGDFMESFTKVSSTVKNRYGILAYLYAGLRALFTMKKYRVKIETDEESIMDDSLLTIISSTASVGSLEKLLPEARIDDNHLHVINISPSSPKEIVEIIIAALRGSISDHRNVQYIRTERLHIDADRLEVMDVDGDALPFETMDIEILPARIKINVPK